MKNLIICNNCNTENPFYNLTCRNCKTYLRDRVVNIDLFRAFGLLIENPVKAFTAIIYAEHKNFITLVLFISSLKLFINSLFLSLIVNKEIASGNILVKLFLFLIIISVIFYALAAVLGFILKKYNTGTRNRDHFSIIVYSLVPYLFGLIILFPTELILFGQYLFSAEPSPFSIKTTLAYLLAGFEIIIILWSLFLTSSAVFVQSRSKFFSLFSAVIIHIFVYLILFIFGTIFYV